MRFLRTFLFSLILSLFAFLTLVCAQKTDKPLLLVLNKNEASMTVYDADSLKELGKVGVGDGPHEVVVSPDGKTAFVANYGGRTPGSTLSVIDLKTMKEKVRADLSPLLRPHGIQEIGGKIYFTAEQSRAIARFDPATNKVDWIMGTGQNASHMVAGSADQKSFYTANIASDSVTMFELAGVPPAPSRITQIPVGKQPEAIDLSPDGKEVWVGLNAEGKIDVVDTAQKKVVKKIDLGARPYRVKFTPDGKYVIATLLGKKEMVVIDAKTHQETRRIAMDSEAWGIIFSKDSKLAYVTAARDNLVYKIDLEKFEVVGKAATGAVPDGVVLSGM
jgi:YVTN family beta-propeller protein